MQKSIWHDVKLKPYSNYFCDCEKSLFFEFVNIDYPDEAYKNYIKLFEKDDIYQLYKYVVMKNAIVGVSELALSAQVPEIALQAMKELNMQGFILSEIDKLQFAGFDKLRCPAVYVDSLLDLSEKELENISDLCAKQKIPLFIKFLQNLDEAGELSKVYGNDALKILEDFGLFDRELYLIGCNYLDKSDADSLLSCDNATIVTTPIADMQFARGGINLYPFVQNGVRVKLGSGENFDINMLGEARLAVGQTASIMHELQCVTLEEAKAMLASKNQACVQIEYSEFEKQKQKAKNIFEKYIAKNIFGGKN